MINSILTTLGTSWKEKGYGIKFGKWSSCTEAWKEWVIKNPAHSKTDLENTWLCILAFVDDLYIVAKHISEGQLMMNDLVIALAEVGLKPKLSKISWMSDNFEIAA